MLLHVHRCRQKHLTTAATQPHPVIACTSVSLHNGLADHAHYYVIVTTLVTLNVTPTTVFVAAVTQATGT